MEWSPYRSRTMENIPIRPTLLKSTQDRHGRIGPAFKKTDAQTLAASQPFEEIRKTFPTFGNFGVILLTKHETTHLHQLSAWRLGHQDSDRCSNLVEQRHPLHQNKSESLRIRG